MEGSGLYFHRQGCEHTCVRRVVGVKRVEMQREEELGEEVGVKESFRRKLVKRRLKWAGHVERMVGESLTETAGALRVVRFDGNYNTSSMKTAYMQSTRVHIDHVIALRRRFCASTMMWHSRSKHVRTYFWCVGHT